MLRSRIFLDGSLDTRDTGYRGRDLLIQTGLIKQSENGFYIFSDLIVRVKRNIENLLRDGFQNLNANEIHFPLLEKRKLWEKSPRFENFKGNMFFSDDYVLSPTREEYILDLLSKTNLSYKSLPQVFYEIKEKYRNELRCKNGLLRTKEFCLFGGYSLATSQQELDNQLFEILYFIRNFFKEISLNIIEASTGEHNTDVEFVVIEDNKNKGEERLMYCSECGKFSRQSGKNNCKCGREYTVFNGYEIGDIYSLGDQLSGYYNASYHNKNGTNQLVYLGGFGMGITKLIGVISERLSNEKGLRWPEAIAPFKYIIIPRNLDYFEKADNVYSSKTYKKCSIFDDRQISFGKKIKEAQLIGIPNIIIVDSSDNLIIENRFHE